MLSGFFCIRPEVLSLLLSAAEEEEEEEEEEEDCFQTVTNGVFTIAISFCQT